MGFQPDFCLLLSVKVCSTGEAKNWDFRFFEVGWYGNRNLSCQLHANQKKTLFFRCDSLENAPHVQPGNRDLFYRGKSKKSCAKSPVPNRYALVTIHFEPNWYFRAHLSRVKMNESISRLRSNQIEASAFRLCERENQPEARRFFLRGRLKKSLKWLVQKSTIGKKWVNNLLAGASGKSCLFCCVFDLSSMHRAIEPLRRSKSSSTILFLNRRETCMWWTSQTNSVTLKFD